MKPTLNTYLSDMLALENELIRPIKAQSENTSIAAMPHIEALIASIHAIAANHIEQLEQQLDEMGGHAGTGIKTSVSAALGTVANVIDSVRKTEVSKDLRDDYTALSLACVSYSMLHTTAMAQGNQQIADFAKSHLIDYATCIMQIQDVLPGTVIAELQSEGVAVDTSISTAVRESLDDAWNQSVSRAGKTASL